MTSPEIRSPYPYPGSKSAGPAIKQFAPITLPILTLLPFAVGQICPAEAAQTQALGGRNLQFRLCPHRN